MKLTKKKKLGAIALCLVGAMSAVCLGFASWGSTITVNGGVSASGKWDVAITNASAKLSTGASAAQEVTVYNLTRTNMKADRDIYGSVTWYKTGGTGATPSDQPQSAYLDYYLVDTTKYGDLVSDSAITAITAEQEAEIIADETTYSVREAVPMQYWSSTAAKIVDALLSDCTTALKEKYPNTYQNYSLVRLASVTSKSFTIGAMEASTESVTITDQLAAIVSEGKDEATFADVSLSLPGAWANYTVTITNNGTVNANLSEYTIDTTELDADNFTVDVPAFEEDEVLAPGESCTFNVVVIASDGQDNELNAELGQFSIKLVYAQDQVEAAPEAAHTHATVDAQ